MHSDKHDVTQSEDGGYSISRQIQYSFTLQNKSHQEIKQAELWTFAPVKQTASQRCLKLQSNYPYKLLTDNSGNQVLHFTFENLAPYGSRVVTIKTHLLVSATANPIPSGPWPRKFESPKIYRIGSSRHKSDSAQTAYTRRIENDRKSLSLGGKPRAL